MRSRRSIREEAGLSRLVKVTLLRHLHLVDPLRLDHCVHVLFLIISHLFDLTLEHGLLHGLLLHVELNHGGIRVVTAGELLLASEPFKLELLSLLLQCVLLHFQILLALLHLLDHELFLLKGFQNGRVLQDYWRRLLRTPVPQGSGMGGELRSDHWLLVRSHTVGQRLLGDLLEWENASLGVVVLMGWRRGAHRDKGSHFQLVEIRILRVRVPKQVSLG